MGRPGGGQPVPSLLLLVHCASRHPTERLLRALLAARTRHARIGVRCVPGSVRGDYLGDDHRAVPRTPAWTASRRSSERQAANSHRCLHIEQYDVRRRLDRWAPWPEGGARSLLHGPPFRPCGLGSCEGLAEEGDCLADCRIGGLGLAQGVEHHEVVDDALEADCGDRDAGLAQLVGVRLALVAEDVGAGGDARTSTLCRRRRSWSAHTSCVRARVRRGVRLSREPSSGNCAGRHRPGEGGVEHDIAWIAAPLALGLRFATDHARVERPA